LGTTITTSASYLVYDLYRQLVGIPTVCERLHKLVVDAKTDAKLPADTAIAVMVREA